MRVTDIAGPVHAAGLLLQDVHPPAPPVAALREGAAPRGRASGMLPKRQDEREWRTEYRRRHADVLVVGGGIAGLHGGARAAELGADVVLADEDAEPGGRLLAEGGHERAARSWPTRSARPGVEILVAGAPALGVLRRARPGLAGRHAAPGPRRAATSSRPGTIEQPLVFAGNDLPGVMLSGGARRLAALYGGRARPRAVVATTSRPRPRGRARAAAAPGVDDRGRRRPAPDGASAAVAALERRRASRCWRGAHGRRGASAAAAVAQAAVDASRRDAGASAASPATCSWSSGGARRRRSLLLQAGANDRLRRPSAARFALADAARRRPRRRRGRRPRATRRRRAVGRARRRRGRARAGPRRRGLARAPGRAQAPGDGWPAAPTWRRAAAGAGRARRQVLRLPLRGHHRQGHRPARRRGL